MYRKILYLSVPNFGSKSIWARKLICPLCILTKSGAPTHTHTERCGWIKLLQFCWSHRESRLVSSVVTFFLKLHADSVCCDMSRKRSRCCWRYTSSSTTRQAATMVVSLPWWLTDWQAVILLMFGDVYLNPDTFENGVFVYKRSPSTLAFSDVSVWMRNFWETSNSPYSACVKPHKRSLIWFRWKNK